MKRLLPILLLPLLLGGCATSFTNLTPLEQSRKPDNLYPVEVAFDSRQQTLRWESINPQIVVGETTYPMRPTLLLTNRWEGLVPVPANAGEVQYRYKFDFKVNRMGDVPGGSSAVSPAYTLKIKDP